MPSVFEITSLENHSKSLTVRLSGVDVCLVNAIRRVVLADLPNVGFRFDAAYHGPDQSISIQQNDTPLHNEFMMHRLSLIPIHLSLKEIEAWDPDRYEFVIEKESTEDEHHVEVTTKDIRVIDTATSQEQKSLRDRLFPACPITKNHIILTKLKEGKGNAFRCTMRAAVNTPSTNASFGMVSMCTFGNVVDEKAAEKARKQIRENNASEEKEEIERRVRQFDTLEVQRKYVVNKFKEACLFDFKIESECAVKANEIMSKAIEILLIKIRALLAEDFEAAQLSEKLFAITIRDATHTEGNVLQALLFNHLIRGDDVPFEGKAPPARLRDFQLTYIGYTVPHPLDNRVVLKFTGKGIHTLEEARTFFQDGVTHVANYIDAVISEEWIKTYANYKK